MWKLHNFVRWKINLMRVSRVSLFSFSLSQFLCVCWALNEAHLEPGIAMRMSICVRVFGCAREHMTTSLSTCTYVPFLCVASTDPEGRKRESSSNDIPFILCECNKRRINDDGINKTQKKKREKIDLLKITHIRTRYTCTKRGDGKARRGEA